MRWEGEGGVVGGVGRCGGRGREVYIPVHTYTAFVCNVSRHTWLVSSAMDTSLVSFGGSQRNIYSLYRRQEPGWVEVDR